MRITSFKYLKRGRILTLMIVLTISSMLFSMTLFSLLGFYRGLGAYLGEEESIIVVYDRKSRTPFTGLTPAFLAEKIKGVNGVLVCSPEVIVPCAIRGETVFLRGVIPKEFAEISRLTIIDGSMLESEDLNHAIAGRGVAERIGLRVGSRMLVVSVLSDVCLELKIRGIFESGSILDDEIIAPLHVGQWLRGTDYNHVTIIRAKVNAKADVREEILGAIAEEASKPSQSGSLKPPSQPTTLWSRTTFRIEDINVGEARKFMENYMERYGVTRESIIILSATTLFFSGVTVALAVEALLTQHKGEIEILRSLGASRRLLKSDILLKLTPISLAALAIGVALAAALLSIIKQRGLLQVLSHNAPLQIDQAAIIISLMATLAIVFMVINLKLNLNKKIFN
ncbi:MAG: FtsX-like permease family protein [Candidatus Bathyarchaeia archaeon]